MSHKTVWMVIIIAILMVGLVYFMKGTSESNGRLTLKSSSFSDGSLIPTMYTCQGNNISPELNWTWNSLEQVDSYLLIVDDPDAKKVVGKIFVHWVVLLSGNITDIPEGISGKLNDIDAHAMELPNDSGKTTYKGPCPPAGSGTHLYRFTLFALSRSLEQVRGALHAPYTAENCRENLAHAIIAQAVLTGKYIQD